MKDFVLETLHQVASGNPELLKECLETAYMQGKVDGSMDIAALAIPGYSEDYGAEA